MRALIGCLALVAACDGGSAIKPPPPPSRDGGTYLLTLGTADAEGNWLPLVDGQDVTLVEGAQGGFHVWMKIRTQGMPDQQIAIAKTAHKVATDQLVLRSMAAAEIMPTGPSETWEIPTAFPMFMCPSPVGISVIDTLISYEIGLSNIDGTDELCHAAITLIPHCPIDQKDFCERICTG